MRSDITNGFGDDFFSSSQRRIIVSQGKFCIGTVVQLRGQMLPMVSAMISSAAVNVELLFHEGSSALLPLCN